MRLISQLTWMGSGWPEWVSDEEFDEKINQINSIISYTMIAFNLVPGLFVDICRKKLKDDYNGNRIGLGILFGLSTIFLVITR